MARTTPADRAYQYYPAFLDLRRKRVVVVGGGEIATGKVRGLLPCGPEPLVVIAPAVSEEIRQAAEAGRLAWHARPYQDGDLAGASLAFGATDDRAANAQVAAEARRRGIPVLAVDDVPHCDFIAPAVVRRGDLLVAISTGGRSPALARRLREQLEQTVTARDGRLLEVAAAARERLGDARRRVSPERWQAALADPEVQRLVDGGALQDATGALLRHLAPAAGGGRPLVGAPVPPVAVREPRHPPGHSPPGRRVA